VLAARAPGIRNALQHAKRSGAAFVIRDGTLVHIDRNQIDRPFYSGKHKRHGMNLQAIADARGNLLWVSGAIRGSIHAPKPPGSGSFCLQTAIEEWARLRGHVDLFDLYDTAVHAIRSTQ
jgi:hypothetical protein